MTKLISDEMVEDALHHLSVSSEPEAAARAMRERLDFERKRIRAKYILNAVHLSSASAREAYAETSDEYKDACERYCKAIEADEAMRSKRNTCVVLIEAWRTQNANERAGNQFR